jgi:hypothetical protein
MSDTVDNLVPYRKILVEQGIIDRHLWSRGLSIDICGAGIINRHL